MMPKAYNGGNCTCHSSEHTKHIAPCCKEIPVTPEEEDYWREREQRT